MIILDTNVVSESFRARPDLKAVAWLNSFSADVLYLCTPVLAELRFGVQRLPPGRRKSDLEATVDRIEQDFFRGRVLPFDAAAAAEYGRVVATRMRMGRPIQTMDALIAAIALSNGATLATRDTSDFAGIGIELVNPFVSEEQ